MCWLSRCLWMCVEHLHCTHGSFLFWETPCRVQKFICCTDKWLWMVVLVSAEVANEYTSTGALSVWFSIAQLSRFSCVRPKHIDDIDIERRLKKMEQTDRPVSDFEDAKAWGWTFTIFCTWTGFVLLFVGICWVISLPRKAWDPATWCVWRKATFFWISKDGSTYSWPCIISCIPWLIWLSDLVTWYVQLCAVAFDRFSISGFASMLLWHWLFQQGRSTVENHSSATSRREWAFGVGDAGPDLWRWWEPIWNNYRMYPMGRNNLLYSNSYGSVSKPCTPGEHQNSW